jgi:hypothetical protein
MLKLDPEQQNEAERRMGVAALHTWLRTDADWRLVAGAALEALAEDFDVSPVDIRDDIESGEVWPVECDICRVPDHSTQDHRSKLIERISNETAKHNRSLGAK